MAEDTTDPGNSGEDKNFDDLPQEEKKAAKSKAGKRLSDEFGMSRERVEELNQITSDVVNGDFLTEEQKAQGYGDTADAVRYIADKVTDPLELALMVGGLCSQINHMKMKFGGGNPMEAMLREMMGKGNTSQLGDDMPEPGTGREV